MSSELVFKKNDDASIIQYDISVIPNDFNVTTIYNLIDSGAIEMPVFQRNYIWDVKRASKFIESLVLGLPIPQIFLYQKARNKFLVIDGQQRLLTIYYFIKQRFPLANKRAILRKIFDDNNGITEEILMDGNYFKDFKLQFGKNESNLKNPLEGLKYSTLDSYGRQDLDTVGTGEGYYITNGYAVPITWSKTSRSDKTHYYYKSGNELVVADGNTMIQVVPLNSNIVFS